MRNTYHGKNSGFLENGSLGRCGRCSFLNGGRSLVDMHPLRRLSHSKRDLLLRDVMRGIERPGVRDLERLLINFGSGQELEGAQCSGTRKARNRRGGGGGLSRERLANGTEG